MDHPDYSLFYEEKEVLFGNNCLVQVVGISEEVYKNNQKYFLIQLNFISR